MRTSEECRYCGELTFRHPEVTVVAKGPPCETCTSKLSRLLASMPDPAGTCGAPVEVFQVGCLKRVGHDRPDSEGKADPHHDDEECGAYDRASGGICQRGKGHERYDSPHATRVEGKEISWSDLPECWCLQPGRVDPTCPIPAHQAKAALEKEQAAIKARKADPFAGFSFKVQDPVLVIKKPASVGPSEAMTEWWRSIFKDANPGAEEGLDVEVEVDGKLYLLRGLRPLGNPVWPEFDDDDGEKVVVEYSFNEAIRVEERTDDQGVKDAAHLVGVSIAQDATAKADPTPDFKPWDGDEFVRRLHEKIAESDRSAYDLDRAFLTIGSAIEACRLLVGVDNAHGARGDIGPAVEFARAAMGLEPKA